MQMEGRDSQYPYRDQRCLQGKAMNAEWPLAGLAGGVGEGESRYIYMGGRGGGESL